jgi:hypothetical protein
VDRSAESFRNVEAPMQTASLLSGAEDYRRMEVCIEAKGTFPSFRGCLAGRARHELD